MGLENLLGVMKDTGGALGSYQQGQSEGYKDQGTLAELMQKRANLDRYTQETPGAVAQVNNQAESSRLGNLPGQADEANNVQQGKSQLTAAQNKQLLDQIPKDVLLKAQNDTREASNDNLKIMSDVMQQTGDMKKALAQGRQHLQTAGANLPPDELQKNLSQFDAAGQQAIQAFGNDPQKWLDKLNFQRNRMAASSATADSKHQGEMQLRDMDNTAAQTRTETTANATKSIAAAKTAADAANPPQLSPSQMLYNAIKGSHPNATKQEVDALYVKAATEVTRTRPDYISPTGTSEEKSVKGDGTTTPDPNLDRLPAGSKFLGDGIYQTPNGKKYKVK